MSEQPFSESRPRLTSHLVEYRVREVTRYILTRFEAESREDGSCGTTSQSYGDFDNFHSADRTGRLVAAGERASAWEGSEIKFTDADGTTIRLNADGTSERVDVPAGTGNTLPPKGG